MKRVASVLRLRRRWKNFVNVVARIRDGISRIVWGMKRKFAPRCQVCRHDERWRIELLRAGGASLDSLAGKFGIHRDAIHRHYRDHVSSEMKASYLAGPVQLQDLATKAAEQGSSVLDHLHAVRVILMGHLASVTEAGDGRAAAYIAGRLTATLESIARVSGELGDLAKSTTFHVTNIALVNEHPAFMKVQATIMRALSEHPEARAAVVVALRELDQSRASATNSDLAKGMVIEHAA